MKIAVVHYHLRPGGLSRAITPLFRAPTDDDDKVFFTGEVPEAAFPGDVPVALSSGMEERCERGASGVAGAQAMMRQAEAALGTKPDLWHVFNHGVGKNLALPKAVVALAEAGEPLLLHLSDFAEDGRPAAYDRLRQAEVLDKLYPVGMHVHYAVNNRRDYLYMRHLGISEFQLHYVPHPVAAPAPTVPIDPNSRFVLYATRGVRRKNLGELALAAAAHRNDWEFGVTLPPIRGDADLWSYEYWHKFCDERALPVAFNLGELPDLYFPDLIAKAACFYSASVAEAFGLAFLEPWLCGRPIVGRALPEVITEFGAAGIALEHLYESLTVPLDWLDRDELQRHADAEWQRTVEAYNREVGPDDMARIREQWYRRDEVDFGFLDERFQTPIIERAMRDSGVGELVAARLPSLQVDEQVVRTNGARVKQLFSIPAYQTRIRGIYQRIVQCRAEPVEYLDAAAVLSCFLQPERFSLLRGLKPAQR